MTLGVIMCCLIARYKQKCTTYMTKQDIAKLNEISGKLLEAYQKGNFKRDNATPNLLVKEKSVGQDISSPSTNYITCVHFMSNDNSGDGVVVSRWSCLSGMHGYSGQTCLHESFQCVLCCMGDKVLKMSSLQVNCEPSYDTRQLSNVCCATWAIRYHPASINKRNVD